jgi:hypothetical protein
MSDNEMTDSVIDPTHLAPHHPFPSAREVPFADFNNRYENRACYVVGRGPTEFDYDKLRDVTDPVFFINDAICLEKLVSADTFFFAHDAAMQVWLNGSIRATAVLPLHSKFFDPSMNVTLGHLGDVVHYRWWETNRDTLLRMTRDELAEAQALFLHSGTIHPLLHFVWYCGFKRVSFIGCDGINSRDILRKQLNAPEGYDPRLQNRSLTSSWWQYSAIRKAQDLLIQLFDFEAIYLGTPRV